MALAGYSFRKTITIDSSKVDTTLTDFPLLVKLTSTNFNFANAESDGSDIRFTEDDGTTELKFQRIRHDDSAEEAEYFVKVPSVSSSADTEIFIYYGNSSAADAADPTNVWDSNFISVLHMDDDLATTAVEDTTSNNNDGTATSNTDIMSVTGEIFKGLDANGDWVDMGSGAPFNFGTGDFTISGWFKTSSIASEKALLAKRAWVSATEDGYAIAFTNSTTVRIHYNTDQDYTISNIADGQWHQIAVRFDYTNAESTVILDGVDQGTKSHTQDDQSNGTALKIGSNEASLHFTGEMDSFRFSDTLRSIDYLETFYQSESDNLAAYGIEEPLGVTITENILINDNAFTEDGVRTINESVLVNDTTNRFSSNTDADFGTKILSINPLIFVTNTDPAEIVKVDITIPSSPIHEVRALTGTSFAKDAAYNTVTGFIYVATADGKVAKVDVDDLQDQTIIDLSDTDDLQKMEVMSQFGIAYTSTDSSTGEAYLIDERETNNIDTDVQVIAPTQMIMDTDVNIIETFEMETDIKVLAEETMLINTDIKVLTDVLDDVEPIHLEDFEVYVDGGLLDANDVALNTIRIVHSEGTKSIATLRLNRYHDNLDQDLDGNTRVITNQNTVRIDILGVTEFEGPISDISCQYDNEEFIIVTAEQDQPAVEYTTKTLSLPSTDARLGLYDVLVQNPVISNPVIGDEETDPRYFKGVFVPIGKKVTQDVKRFIQIDTTGSFADSINAGTFTLRQNRTYFWGSVEATNINSANVGSPEGFQLGQVRARGFAYIGTSLSPLASDVWVLTKASHRFQRIFPDDISRLGNGKINKTQIEELNIGDATSIFNTLIGEGYINASGEVQNSFRNFIFDPITWSVNLTTTQRKNVYTLMDDSFGVYIGNPPYKTVSASRNGILDAKFRWEDRSDGLYSVKDEGYDFTNFVQQVAELEFEKIKNINGSILPETSCNLTTTVDAYYYYKLKLLNRINIDNTMQSGEFKDNNGFPVAIKSITISAEDRKVSFVANNIKTADELEALDGQFPNEDDFIEDPDSIKLLQKFDMSTLTTVE